MTDDQGIRAGALGGNRRQQFAVDDFLIGKISRGRVGFMPTPLQFDTSDKWTIGEPDLVLRSPEVIVPAVGPDRWGDIGLVSTGLTEDRYASAVEVREVNDIPKTGGTSTVGGRFVFHHMYRYWRTLQWEASAAKW